MAQAQGKVDEPDETFGFIEEIRFVQTMPNQEKILVRMHDVALLCHFSRPLPTVIETLCGAASELLVNTIP